MNEVVPFGKHKGKPVEVLLQDKPYTEWLLAQPWFEERFATICALVRGAGEEPQETPEHNALQVKFLELEFCERILGIEKEKELKVNFEVDGWDVTVNDINFTNNSCVCLRGGDDSFFYLIEIKPQVGDDYPAILRQMKINHTKFITNRRARRVDGKIILDSGPSTRLVLYTQKIEARGATPEQITRMFEASGIKVVVEGTR